MLFIHRHTSIAPQPVFDNVALDELAVSTDNQLKAAEPSYAAIPPGILRRMGKAVRMGIGAAVPLLQSATGIDGMIIGTANGGMEDCIKFLNQIIDYEEGMLTPGNFVQSTPNAIAGQLGLMTKNQSYNITHVHRGLAFEMALLDAVMQAKENPGRQYLLGSVDEISDYNFNIDLLAGWYKRQPVSNTELYRQDSPGSIAGEGAAMFLVSDQSAGAEASIEALTTFHTEDPVAIEQKINDFITKHTAASGPVDLLITGENGDNRFTPLYVLAEKAVPEQTAVARYKHMTGEYPTSSSFALWLACYLFGGGSLPAHAIKKTGTGNQSRRVLIYNAYKGSQHSLLLVSKK